MAPKKVKGGKAKKTKGTKASNRGAGNRNNNPRAFLAASGPKAMRNNAYRALEKQEKQYHVQLVDRSAEATVPPPYIVVVVGPPGVGKSTLIQSLVKHWTKQNIGEVIGPITVVTGKKRRLTIVECPNDMNAMCDLSKVRECERAGMLDADGERLDADRERRACTLPWRHAHRTNRTKATRVAPAPVAAGR